MMNNLKIDLNKLKCSFKPNPIEIKLLKGQYLKRKPIPLPWINKNNEVIAFASSYFALKELEVSPIYVGLKR